MNVEQYLKDRADLAVRLVREMPSARPFAPDWRSYGPGLVGIAAAMGLEVWTSVTQTDPGVFARTSTFLLLVLCAATWLLSIAQYADYRLARLAVTSHYTVKEKVLNQLFKIDGSIAHKAIGSGK